MPPKIAIIFNEPTSLRYGIMGEEKAIFGVLKEVDAVYSALNELEYPVIRVPLRPPVEQVQTSLKRIKADVVFNLFEGFEGKPETEAIVADMLKELGLRFTGCPGNVLALALDKGKTKNIFKSAGLKTPEYQLLTPDTIYLFKMKYPCIVKPCGEDASHGLSEENIVYDFTALEKQVLKITGLFGGKALVEEFLQGREFNTTVLGNKESVVLPISEIIYSLPEKMPRLLTYAAKWEEGSIYFQCTNAVCPAEINEGKKILIGNTALNAFKLVGCRGYARIDMRLDQEEEVNVLEINPNPDISPDAGAARQVKAAGLTYSQFIEKIIILALER